MAFNLTRALASKALMARNLKMCKINPYMLGAPLHHATSNIGIKVHAAPPALAENLDEKAVRLHRPSSPHLSIYKLELPMLLSGTHRTTGFFLTIFTWSFGLGQVLLPAGADSIFQTFQMIIDWAHFGMPIIVASKFLIAFPLTYHAVNGCRHMIWDTGKFLGMKEVYTTGYIMYALALLGAAFCASL